MPKKIFLMSASSNSGKTVLANGLIHIASKNEKKVQFYKPLSIDISSRKTQDGSLVATYMTEYSSNAKAPLRALNNTAYYNPESQTLHCHGRALTQCKLVARDNIDCDSLDSAVVAQIRERISQDLKCLLNNSDILIAEGGGNCLLGGPQEFSNRWPATEFDFSVVLVVEGRDGGGFLSLLGLKYAMPAHLHGLVIGFVVNGVIERNETIEKTIEDLSTKTQWPCLGVLPWFSFEENNSYEDWQTTLEEQLKKHAQPLLGLL